jgi:hypothetical protein
MLKSFKFLFWKRKFGRGAGSERKLLNSVPCHQEIANLTLESLEFI